MDNDMPQVDYQKLFKEFDAQYQKWYGDFEKRDGLKEGVLVKYIGLNEKNDVFLEHPQYCGSPSVPRSLLSLDKVYEIEYRLLARSWQLVKLVGFPYDVAFYPDIFEVIGSNPESIPLRKCTHLRYIGPEDIHLDYGKIYQVEGFIFGYGHVYVRLSGIDHSYERGLFERSKD